MQRKRWNSVEWDFVRIYSRQSSPHTCAWQHVLRLTRWRRRCAEFLCGCCHIWFGLRRVLGVLVEVETKLSSTDFSPGSALAQSIAGWFVRGIQIRRARKGSLLMGTKSPQQFNIVEIYANKTVPTYKRCIVDTAVHLAEGFCVLEENVEEVAKGSGYSQARQHCWYCPYQD